MSRLIDADALIGALHDHAFLEGDDRAIAYNVIQKQPTVGGWISVKVAKPTPIHRECDRNKHLPVLLYARKDDSIYVGWYVGEDYRGIDCYISRTSMSSYQHITKKITHWMPRPKTPEG